MTEAFGPDHECLDVYKLSMLLSVILVLQWFDLGKCPAVGHWEFWSTSTTKPPELVRPAPSVACGCPPPCSQTSCAVL